jgi:hypothetical protein
VSRRGSPAPAAPASPAGDWNPFERVYGQGGAIDREYASKRLPTLVDLLRRNPACFPLRIDVARLGELLAEETSRALRESPAQDRFEEELRKFSEARLHELADEALQKQVADALMGLARDEALTRRDRAGAALGVALLATPPDPQGLRGRGLMDLILRVTMEEETAQEQLRKKARETEGGLSAEELNQFWEQYPALRWRHEERYRREVRHVLQAIEKEEMPPALSVDLGMRGAAKLLAAVAEAKAKGREVASHEAEQILRAPFVQDMMEDGGEVVVARWRAEMARPGDGRSAERRAVLRSLEMGARIVEEQGPGTDAVLFYLYLRAVVQGHYFVRDAGELEAAKELFAPTGLVPEGALAYAAHLRGRGDTAAEHRVLLAAFEIWPDDARIRAAAEAMGLREEAAAQKTRLGPNYEKGEETSGGAGGDAA